MVALSLFRVREGGGGPIVKSKTNIIYIYISDYISTLLLYIYIMYTYIYTHIIIYYSYDHY